MFWSTSLVPAHPFEQGVDDGDQVPQRGRLGLAKCALDLINGLAPVHIDGMCEAVSEIRQDARQYGHSRWDSNHQLLGISQKLGLFIGRSLVWGCDGNLLHSACALCTCTQKD
jgi:hypothetical protein